MSNCYANDFTNTVKTYYKDIKKCNPISREEEKDLMHKAKSNDLIARNKILTSNLKFVFDVAKKYKGFGVPMEELISEGNMGLIHAFEKFDESKDVKFISYAVWWINSKMIDCVKENAKKKDAEVSEDEIMSATVKSKGIADNEDEEINTKDIVASDFDDLAKKEDEIEKKETIKHLLSKLDLRERKIIENYFGLNDDKPKTLEECGKLLNLSKERIRQVKAKSLLKMRSEMLLLS